MLLALIARCHGAKIDLEAFQPPKDKQSPKEVAATLDLFFRMMNPNG